MQMKSTGSGGGGSTSFPLLATPADSAAAPSYSWLADPNTGLYNIGADQLGISAGGTLRLTVSTTAVTSTVPIRIPDGVNGGDPGLQFSSATGYGILYTTGELNLVANQITMLKVFGSGIGGAPYGGLATRSDGSYAWGSVNADFPDLFLFRLGPASLRQGAYPNASPISQTFTIGEASRPGTDTNVGGADGTIRSGLGTGTGAASSLIFQTPTLVGSGSSTQTYATRLTVATAAVTATVEFKGAANLGYAMSGSGRIYDPGNSQIYFNTGSLLMLWLYDNVHAALESTVAFGWCSGAVGGTNPDVTLYRDGPYTLAQRLSTNAQSFRLYSTYTDASNYERLTFATTIGSKVSIIAETAGTGANDLDIEILPVGAGVVEFGNSIDGAAAQVATMTNGPTAGDPSNWLKIKAFGGYRYIPVWL